MKNRKLLMKMNKNIYFNKKNHKTILIAVLDDLKNEKYFPEDTVVNLNGCLLDIMMKKINGLFNHS